MEGISYGQKSLVVFAKRRRREKRGERKCKENYEKRREEEGTIKDFSFSCSGFILALEDGGWRERERERETNKGSIIGTRTGRRQSIDAGRFAPQPESRKFVSVRERVQAGGCELTGEPKGRESVDD